MGRMAVVWDVGQESVADDRLDGKEDERSQPLQPKLKFNNNMSSSSSREMHA